MENNMVTGFNTAVAVIGGVVGWLIGEVDGILTALIAFIVIDYITGVIVGISNKTLNSAVGFKGLFKKIFILFLVMIANIIDVNLMDSSGIIRGVVIMFYIANEGISILENAGKLGVSYPEKLKQVLEQLKEGKQNANKF